MKYFKAFNKGMMCRGKQYEEGKEYEENGGKICGAGMMHFCETPFDTLDYYPLIDNEGNFSEFAEVEPLAEIVKCSNKCASKKIKIGAKLSFKDFIKAGVEVLIEKTKFKKPTESNLTDKGKYFAQIGSSGYGAKIGSSGYGAKIGSSGDGAQIGSSGDGAQIGSSGYGAKIGSSGDWAQIGSSGYGAKISSSGYGAKISSSGYGAKIKMEGKRSVASAIGARCQISGKKGDWIVLAEWDFDNNGKCYPKCVKAGQIDGETLKEDVMYRLENGEFKCD